MDALELAAALLKTTDVYAQRILDKAKAHDIDPHDLIEHLHSLNGGEWSINYFSIIREMIHLLLKRAERIIDPDWEDGDDRSLVTDVHYSIEYHKGDLLLNLNTQHIIQDFDATIVPDIVNTLNWDK